MTLSLKWARRRALLEAADDVAQRALTFFRRGCTWIATRHLPGGGHAMVLVGNDRDVHRAGALRGRARLGENQRLELGSCPRRLVRHDPLLARNVAALERVIGESAALRFSALHVLQRSRARSLSSCHATRFPGAVAFAARCARTSGAGHQLRTTCAAQPDGARPPGVWASESGPRAAPASGRPCARAG